MSRFVLTAGFVDADGVWQVAVSDGALRGRGRGKTFGDGLRVAVAAFRDSPETLASTEPQFFISHAAWAYIDGLSPVEGPDGQRWAEIFAWVGGGKEPATEIETLDGRVGICVPANGAACMHWRRKQWMNVSDEGDDFLRDVDDDLGGSNEQNS